MTYRKTTSTTSTTDVNTGQQYFLTITKDENQITSQYTWKDALGQVRRLQTGDDAGAIASENTYDFYGRLTSSTDPGGLSTTYTYNGAGSVASKSTQDQTGPTEYLYDVFGDLRFGRTPEQNDKNEFTSTLYDPYGRVTGTAIIRDPTTNYFTTYWAENLNSELTRYINTANQECTAPFGCDAENDMQFTWKTLYYYDGDENIIDFKPILNAPAEVYTTSGRSRGRLVAKVAMVNGNNITEANCVIDAYEYDDFGRIKKHVKKIPGLKSKMEEFSYDEAGRVSVTHFSDDLKLIGQILAPVYQYYYYDDLGRITKVERGTNPSSDKKKIATYNYNDSKSGLLSRVALGESKNNVDKPLQGIDYAYNIRDWLVQINNQNLTEEPTAYNDQFGELLGYNNYDHIATLLGNSSTFATDYAQYNGNISWSIWNTAGNSTAPDDNEPSSVRGYLHKYDSFGRLSKAKDGIWNVPGNSWHTLNNNDRTMVARYDADGKLLYHKMNAGTAAEPETNLTYHYKHDESNNNISHQLDYVSTKTSNGMRQQSAGNYEYDKNGNLIKDYSKAMLITYDWRNMPERYKFYPFLSDGVTPNFSVDPVSVIRMVYDADGNRVSKTEEVQ
jgi:YD repeat-containing protein